MKRLALLVTALLLCSAVFVWSARAEDAPLRLITTANPPSVRPGGSSAAVVGISRTDPTWSDVSVRIAVDPALDILSYSASNGGCGREGQIIVCVGPVRSGDPALIALDLRAAAAPHCAPFVSNAQAMTKFTTETATIDLTIETDACVFAPLIQAAPTPTPAPYPAP